MYLMKNQITKMLFITLSPKQKPVLDSLDDLDPEMKRTFDKLGGYQLEEQKRLKCKAVDIVMDSVSVVTSFKETLLKKELFSVLFQTYKSIQSWLKNIWEQLFLLEIISFLL